MFKRISVLGTGLMGGAFAFAVRRLSPARHVTGWDSPEVLDRALQRKAIDIATPDLSEALATADLVYIALPVGAALEVLPQIARQAPRGALVTDACSTKQDVCRVAASCFPPSVRFLGGHPLAGKETRGIDSASVDLFQGAPYALVADASDADERVQEFATLLRGIGAKPVWLDAESHDRAVAFTSHLPQLVAIAMAALIAEEMPSASLLQSLASRGLRDTLRLAGSSYTIWHDICRTNRANIDQALARLQQSVGQLRAQLASQDLQDRFAKANEVYDRLRDLE